jgi:hypothetical protein
MPYKHNESRRHKYPAAIAIIAPWTSAILGKTTAIRSSRPPRLLPNKGASAGRNGQGNLDVAKSKPWVIKSAIVNHDLDTRILRNQHAETKLAAGLLPGRVKQAATGKRDIQNPNHVQRP